MSGMIYSSDRPAWQNAGETATPRSPKTALQVLDENMYGGFTVEQRPITYTINGGPSEPKHLALVRTGEPGRKEVELGLCTERYHPLNPRDVCRVYDENVGENVETMGILGKGQQMFISWKMPEFEVVKDDLVQMYGIVKCGFDAVIGAGLFTAPFRVWCKNTLVLAESWASKHTDGRGKGNIFKGRGVNLNLLRDLGYWLQLAHSRSVIESQNVQSFFGKLAQVPITSDAEMKDILYEAFPAKESVSDFFPAPLRAAKIEKEHAENEQKAEIRDGIFSLFAGAGTGITPTYWGALNATTEFFCHVLPSKKAIATSIVFGDRNDATMKMVNVLNGRIG
jgi:hypothetical protein